MCCNSENHCNECQYSISLDTPQNSPLHNKMKRNEFAQQNNGVGGPFAGAAAPFRHRKLSNSSLASDVSFRLPTYDSPATYHLQSDFESASEFEDLSLGSNTNLDAVKKEQLHDAYKKAMDRYQKYRERYMEVARRYRDLERDNSKARVSMSRCYTQLR